MTKMWYITVYKLSRYKDKVINSKKTNLVRYLCSDFEKKTV